MNKAYLSVDLDYWMLYQDSRSANKFFDKVFALDVPIICVIEHEELLKDMNKKQADILYNIDYHSDLCSDRELYEDDPALDGSWGNFVSWRKNAEFVWICHDKYHCYEREHGVCHCEKKYNPFKYQNQTPWKKTRVSQDLKTIDWSIVTRVGVCISPCYLDPKTVRGAIKRLGMKYSYVRDLVRDQPDHMPDRKRGTIYQVA